MSYSASDAAAADALYGFPPGTLEALAGTESTYGTNTGTIGNTYQIEPATAANPGYGLGQLDGNNAYDAGAYLSALTNGPGGGDLSTGLAMYHGGAGNPTPYGSSSPIGGLLAGLDGSGSSSSSGTYDIFDGNGNWIGMTNDLPLSQSTDPPGYSYQPQQSSPLSGLGSSAGSPLGDMGAAGGLGGGSGGSGGMGGSSSSSLTWMEELAIRALLVLVGLVMLIGGFILAAHRSQATTITGSLRRMAGR